MSTLSKKHTLCQPVIDKGINRPYCGPFAIQALTGCSYREARALVNRWRGLPENTHVTGVDYSAMKYALQQLGYKVTVHKQFGRQLGILKPSRPTLNQYLSGRTRDDLKRRLLIEVTGHYVVVQFNDLIDNHTRAPVHLSNAPHKRRKVNTVYHVS